MLSTALQKKINCNLSLFVIIQQFTVTRERNTQTQKCRKLEHGGISTLSNDNNNPRLQEKTKHFRERGGGIFISGEAEARSIVNRAFCYPSGGHRKDLSPGWSEIEAPANARAGRRSNWQGILYSLWGTLANTHPPPSQTQ